MAFVKNWLGVNKYNAPLHCREPNMSRMTSAVGRIEANGRRLYWLARTVQQTSVYNSLHRNIARHYSSYICLDEAPEVGSGGFDQDQALIYAVEVGCGTLPCSEFINNRELACIVCSKWWTFTFIDNEKMQHWHYLSFIPLQLITISLA